MRSIRTLASTAASSSRRSARLLAVISAAALAAAHASAQVSVTVTIPGNANPWLAGMPGGSTAAGGDTAPTDSPTMVPFAVIPGNAITFSNVTGMAGYSGNISCPPDGCGYNFCHSGGAENGISGACWSTASCLIGVFLDDSVPTTTPAPAASDFSMAGANDYTVLHPLLKQVFFIGDGQRSDMSQQSIIPPAGATRLFLGTADGSGWYDNVGSFTATVSGGCAGITSQPVSTLACPSGSAQFTVAAAGAGSPTYRWQLQTAPDVWTTLGNDPLPLACAGGGAGGFAYATPINSATVTIGIRPCPGSPTAPQQFQVRAVATTSCGDIASLPATYTICPADFNCSHAVSVQDIFDFLAAWFAGTPSADFNQVNGLGVQDIFDFLSAWFAGC